MIEKMSGVNSLPKRIEKSAALSGSAERAAIREMVKSAKQRGLEITGPDGLLKLLTKTVLETALEEEMTDHLGYQANDPEGRNGGNSRNGLRAKTVISEAAGEMTIEVPRDRDGSFCPVIVKKRQRRLGDVDKIVLSLYGKGLTTGEISAHFAEIYGVSVSSTVVSTITDKVMEEQQAWSSRPLQSHYVAVFVDAIHVKVRDGAVANRPFYAAIGVDLRGHRDVLGVWAGTPGGRGVVEVLDLDPDRAEEPRRGRHLLPGLRRAERNARKCEHHLHGDHRSDLSRAPHQEYLQVLLEALLAGDRPRPETSLHRGERRGRARRVRIVRREMG